jgi:PKD repeat protein
LFAFLLAGCSGGDGAGLSGGAAGAPAARVDEPGALAALAVPDGVEPELWDMLTAELSRVLAERDAAATRTASTPPMGETSATVLTYNASASTLAWRYYSHGDYNQDGLVGISDLTPLGQHYGEGSPLGAGQPFPPDSLGAVIDGNGDGIINISDITQIGQNYGVLVAGYRIYASEVTYPYPVEPAGPNREGAMLLDTVDMDAGSDIPGERRRFYSQVVPTEEEQYYWVRPYHESADGVASNLVEVQVPPNQPPEAVLLHYGAARTPAHIRWDALASRDDDGAVVRYEWDFDDDGEFEYDSEDATQVSFYYYEEGQYTCTLRVTDDEGATDTDATDIYVYELATWHVNLADERLEESPGQNPIKRPIRLLEADGHPAMFYTRQMYERDPVTGSDWAVVYTKADDPHGENWSEPQLMAWQNFGVIYETFRGTAAIVDGHPAVVCQYSIPVDFDLKTQLLYRRAGDPAGSSWPDPIVAYQYTWNGQPELDEKGLMLASLSVVEGRPAIIGRDAGDMPSRYTRANDSNGSSWPLPWETDFELDSNEDLAIVSGLPAVVSYETDHDDLLYYRALGVDATAWSEEAVLIDEHEKPTNKMQLISAAGHPAVVYYDTVTDDLKYRRALNPEGMAWGEPVVLDTRASNFSRTAVIDGRPAVIYIDRIADKYMFISANDDTGTRWGFPSEIPLEYGSLSSFFDDYYYHNQTGFPDGITGSPAFAYTEYYSEGQGPPTWKRLYYVAYY